MEQIVLFPHLGSATVHTRPMDQLVVDNLLAWSAGNRRYAGAGTPWPVTKRA